MSINFVRKHPKTPILYETPNGNVICIYRSQIFDATQNESQEATNDAIKILGGKRKKLYIKYQYFKLSCDKIQSSKKSN